MAVGIKRRPEESMEGSKPKTQKLDLSAKSDINVAASSAEKSISAVPPSMYPQVALITSSQRSPFEKRVWTLLCQIPRGSFSTYGLLATHLKSSPRAVGNALRRNPFAPDVPCHRVVATGGTLGGFKGKWPRDGEGITLDEKRKLLRGEGVRFDGKGKVMGTPFGGFV